jgi:hypothetical protein
MPLEGESFANSSGIKEVIVFRRATDLFRHYSRVPDQHEWNCRIKIRILFAALVEKHTP